MAEFSGALIFANANQSITSGAYRIPNFPAELYDEGGWYNPSDDGVIRVPSGITLVRPAFNLYYSVSGIDGRVVKNGISYFGMPHAEASSAGTEVVNAVGAITAASAGTTLAAQINAPNGALNSGGLSWFFVEAIDPEINYALVGKSANQAIPSNLTTSLTWQSEAVDTLGFHNTSSNTGRLTIPAGTTGLFRLCANVSSPGSLNGAALEIRKNGSSIVPGLPIRDSESSGAIQLNVISAIVEAAEGDYFEAFFRSSGTAVTIGPSDNNWFQIEEVRPCLRALAYLSAPQAIPAATYTAVPIDTSVYDLGGWLTGGLFVVPPQVTHVRITFRVEGASQALDMHGLALVNNGMPVGTGYYHSDTTGTDFTSGQSAIIPVTPGDEIELVAYSTSAREVAAGSWMAVEAANFHDALAIQGSALFLSSGHFSASIAAHRHLSANFTVNEVSVAPTPARFRFASGALTAAGSLTAGAALNDPWMCEGGDPVAWAFR